MNAKLIASLFALIFFVCRIDAFCDDDSFFPEDPFDPVFSDNACIVYGEYTDPDCSLFPPGRGNSTDNGGCPGYPDDEDVVIVLPRQIVYENLVDALENCPFDPVLIEYTGTQYIYDGYGVFIGLFYNQTKDLIIRGIDYFVSTGGDTITIIELQNQTFVNSTFDSMTNTTVNVTYVAEVPVSVNVTTPIVNITQQAAIVGLAQLQVTAQNISITLDNVYVECCGSELPIFMTEVKPLRCVFPEELIECCGAYFRQVDAETILNNGTCQRTGAYFDGFRYLRPNSNETAWHQLQTEATIEAWVRPDEDGDMPRHTGIVVVSYYDDDTDDSGTGGFGLVWADSTDENGYSQVLFNVAIDGDFGTPLIGTVPRGQWSHVAGVWDNGVQSLYINGELAGTITRSQADIDYANDGYKTRYGAQIGRAYSETNNVEWVYFNGTIDEARIWQEARTQPQIQALRYETLDTPSYPTLIGHWRFDKPIGAETDYYLNNLAAIAIGRVDLDTVVGFKGSGGPWGFQDPPAMPICFCENPDGLCVANDLYQEFPFEAVLSDYMDTCLITDNCTFVHGMIIDPNGEFGRLWLPGLKEISGPSYNLTMRFIPGRFEEQPNYVDVFNTTTNTTMSVQNGTAPVFIPGAVAEDLPYVDGVEYYSDGFVPGWFINDGFAPYWSGNFIPGQFFPADVANSTYGIPLPVDWEEGDLVFVPGFTNPDGSLYTSGMDIAKNMQVLTYQTLLALVGGVAYNYTKDVDPCKIPAPPEMTEVGMNMTILEDEFGCQIIPGQEAPLYLDPTARDPCAILAGIRALLPTGTEALPAEYVLGCNMTAFVEAPLYLDPTQRDPCSVLKELRDQITGNDTFRADCEAAGGTVAQPEYMGCLKNQNLTIVDSLFKNCYGELVICQHSCTENTELLVEYSVFQNIPGSAIWSSGLENYNIHDNIFCPCGGTTPACVYLNANHITQGEFAIYNNRHCGVADLAPVSCDYDISTVVRCQGGFLYCLDALQTQLNGCPFLSVTEDYGQYDSDCAVFNLCDFPVVTETITLMNGQQVTINTTAGDIEINLPFLTPVLEELTGGNTTLTIPCVSENSTYTITYVDFQLVEVEYNNTGPYMNETSIVMEEMPVNVTETFEIEGCAAAGELVCPCPIGFDPTRNITGIGSGSTSITTCNTPIPDAPYGETCVDRVVWCPFEGGTFGTGEAPPVPVGDCDGGSAVVVCDNSTCVGGQLYYEGVYHACNLATCNATGYMTVPCSCENGALDVVCDRTTCIGTPCPNITVCDYAGGVYQNNTMSGMCECCVPSANVTCANPACTPVSPPMYDNSLCEVLDGDLVWDFNSYPCYLPENSTLCQGGSYVMSEPTPPDGYLTIPCDNSYDVPGPGPCSCIENVDIGGNTTIVGNMTTGTGYTNNTSLTMACLADGTLACRCDTANATNQFLGNFTSRPPDPNAAAFLIDHVPAFPRLWFQQNNVAQDLPIGWRFERFGVRHDSGYDVIVRFALKVPHYYTGHGIIYESRRLSPYISGTTHDWEDGHPNQWNLRWCDPSLTIFDDPCYQYRPIPLVEACLVNRLYNPMTPDYGVLRYARIQDAISGNDDEGIAQCSLSAVIVERSENFYEERNIIARDRFWLGSYDRAVIVGSNHRIVADFITLRGLTYLHPNTNDFPILVPAQASRNFDRIEDSIAEGEQETISNSLVIQNCEFVGDGVNDIGAIVGIIGDQFQFEYNVVRSFFVRAIDIAAQNGTIVRLNRFKALTGRAFRGRAMQSIIFEENLFEECIGLAAGKDVDIVSIESRTPNEFLAPPADPATIAAMLNFILGIDYDEAAFENAINPLALSPDADIGCNPNKGYVCTFRGNRQIVTAEQSDLSTVVYSFTRGGWTVPNIRDNMANHGQIAMKFVETPFISFASRSALFITNALARVSGTRSMNDNPYDFAFQPPGQFQWIGCAFPDCLDINLFYPEMEVNPRFDFIISDFYGFAYINNVTECNTYSLELNPCRITSGRARLRREDILFRRDMYAIGELDFPCCDRPVIKGNHLIAADLTALQTIEWWYFFELNDFEPGFELFRTQEEFLAYQIFFDDNYFDGRYYLYEFRSRMIDVHMRAEDGDFTMINSVAYNWWHYPEGTIIGFIEDDSEKGLIGVVALPNGDVFKWQRSPDMDGVMVRYRPYTVVDINPFVIPQQTEDISESEFDDLVEQLGSVEAAEQYIATQDGRARQPIPPPSSNAPESFFTMKNNYFVNFDGNAVRVIAPGNIDFTENVFHDCGMRQFEEHALLNFEMNVDSVGDYVWESNYCNQTKSFLFPFGGGDGNKVRFACWEGYNAGRPRRFRIWNTTCVLLENQEDPFELTPTTERTRIELRPKPARSDGLFADPFGFNSVSTDDIPVFDTTLEDITKTDQVPSLTATGFRTSENSRVITGQSTIIQYATGMGAYKLDVTQRGYTVGIRLYSIDRETILKTLTPGRQNTTLFPFFQPGLYPLRVLANELNAINATLLFAEGVYTPETLPTNGDGRYVNGMNADIVFCAGFEDAMDGMFEECAVCNDGCPVIPPDSCIVDPGNDTFVPENPYYNRWIFVSVNSAVHLCADPNRRIRLVKQEQPYQLPWDLQGSNFTIFSTDGAVVKVSQHSVLIGGHDLTFRNITFQHWLGDRGPTVRPHSSVVARNTTFERCTFDGMDPTDSLAPAIDGDFENFALVKCTFKNYGGDHVVRVLSQTSCSIFEADANTFTGAPGYSIYAVGFDTAVVQKNKFIECGGERVNQTAVVYLGMCLESMVELVFADNWHSQKPEDVLFPQSGDGVYVSAFWIDGVTNKTGAVIDLTGNEAEGLPVGFRVTNYERRPSIFEGDDPRQDVRWVYAWNRNIAVQGTWHFIVVLPILGNSTVAYFDQLIEADPGGTTRYYCDADCAGSGGQYKSLIIFLAVIAAFFGTFFFCVQICFSTNIDLGGFVYSPALEQSFPADQKYHGYWSRLNMGNQGTDPNNIEPYKYNDARRDADPSRFPIISGGY